MVKLHIKKSDESQFLYETTTDIPTEQLIAELVPIYNGRLKVNRICAGQYEVDHMDGLGLGWGGGVLPTFSDQFQNILSKFVYCKNHTSYENFKLKLCTCARSHVLGTRTKFQLEILTINVISGIVYFRKIIF